MRFTLTIEMDNAAFDRSPGTELSRILRELNSKLYREHDIRPNESGKVRDVNGNTVGEWAVTEDAT
jgi:hypothetical protein